MSPKQRLLGNTGNCGHTCQCLSHQKSLRFELLLIFLIEDFVCPEIFHGEPIMDRKSTFQCHLAGVTSKQEVNQVMSKLLSNKKIADATHNVLAYR